METTTGLAQELQTLQSCRMERYLARHRPRRWLVEYSSTEPILRLWLLVALSQRIDRQWSIEAPVRIPIAPAPAACHECLPAFVTNVYSATLVTASLSLSPLSPFDNLATSTDGTALWSSQCVRAQSIGGSSRLNSWRALCVLSCLCVYPLLSPLLPSVALVVAVISTLPPCHKLTFLFLSLSLPPVNAPVDSFKFAFLPAL